MPSSGCIGTGGSGKHRWGCRQQPGRIPRFFLFPAKFQLYAMERKGTCILQDKGQPRGGVLMLLFAVGFLAGAAFLLFVFALMVVSSEVDNEKHTR